jgi:hypothetical protein
MASIGFSTGAIARGDFTSALVTLRPHALTAIELSALRDHELAALMRAIPELDLAGYDYISVHAPSKLATLSERDVVRMLAPCVERGWPVVVHPDAIQDIDCWRGLGKLACIENMDTRKPIGRTAAELRPIFDRLPEASFCFDFGHACQVDATLQTARELIREFGDRMIEIHLSEVDSRWHHRPLSIVTVLALQEIAHLLPQCPVILESMVSSMEIPQELRLAASAITPPG